MRNVFLVVLFTALVFGCSSEKKSKQDAAGVQVAQKYNRVMAATDSAWNEMMASEDRKLENIKLIIKELGLIDGNSAKHLEQINGDLESLKNNRYDRFSMANSALIDRYDSLTNALIGELRKEIHFNKEAVKYQVVNQLMAEIQSADDSVLFLRQAYDKKIDRWKTYVKENRKKLSDLISNPDSLKNLHYFRLMP
jgi:hypothetical protein